MYTKKIMLLLFSFVAHAQEDRSSIECIVRLTTSDVIYAHKEKGMWGADGIYHAGWYDGVHPKPFLPLDKDMVMTPYWHKIERASPKEKVWALFIACTTDDEYLNFRNNVAAALYCNPDERALPIIQEKIPGGILAEVIFKNDVELVSLLLTHKANVHEHGCHGYPIDRVRTIEIAKELIAHGALANEHIRPMHEAMFCLCEPALITFYRDEHKVSVVTRDRLDWSPLMHLALSLDQQSIEMILDKAERLLRGLSADQRVTFIAMESPQGTVFDFIEHKRKRHQEFLEHGTFYGSKSGIEDSHKLIKEQIHACDRLRDYLTAAQSPDFKFHETSEYTSE